jgi:hypothetical protein
VTFWALSKSYLSQSSTTAIRGIEIGKDVMFGFKLNKMSRSGVTCNMRGASSLSQSFRKRPVVCGHLQYQDPFTRRLEEDTTNSVHRNVNLIYSMTTNFVLLKFPRVTQWCVDGLGLLTNELNIRSPSSGEFSTNCMILFILSNNNLAQLQSRNPLLRKFWHC